MVTRLHDRTKQNSNLSLGIISEMNAEQFKSGLNRFSSTFLLNFTHFKTNVDKSMNKMSEL